MRSPGTTVGESEAWVVCQSTGDSCLEEIFTEEYSNILWGAENESPHSAWGLIVGSFSSAGDWQFWLHWGFWNLTLRGVSFWKALWLGKSRIFWSLQVLIRLVKEILSWLFQVLISDLRKKDGSLACYRCWSLISSCRWFPGLLQVLIHNQSSTDIFLACYRCWSGT